MTFRLAEFYLNYAEAMLNLTDDGYTAAQGFIMTPAAALNVVRKRAGQPNIEEGLDAATFMSRLKNERFVELAFEGHRFFDVRRWKEAPKYFTTIRGMEINKVGEGFTYTPKVIQNRQWDDKMYLFPIPQSEILKSGAPLTQNPGW